MLYFTRPNDTAASVAARFASCFEGLGQNDLASKILKENRESLAVRLYQSSDFLAPNRPLWIPTQDTSAHAPEQHTRREIIQTLDHICPSHLALLTQAQRDGVNIHQFVRANQLLEQVNSGMQDKDIGLVGGAFAAGSVTRVVDLKEGRMSEFEKCIEDLHEKLRSYVQAVDKETKRLARSGYKKAVLAINENFGYEIREYELNASKYYRKYWKALKWAQIKKEGVAILDSSQAKEVARAAKHLKRLARGLFVIDIAAAGYDTIQAMREGKDWVKELGRDTVDIVSAPFAAEIIEDVVLDTFFVFTPVGWIALIAVGVVEAGLAMGGADWFNRHVTDRVL